MMAKEGDFNRKQTEENTRDEPLIAKLSGPEAEDPIIDAAKMIQQSLDSHGNPKLILYKYRWVVLISFTLSLVSVGILGCTCTTTTNLVKEIYDLSVLESNLANSAYLIMYIPGNFLSIFLLRRYGVKISIFIAALLFIIGGWIRLFLLFSEGFSVFFIGSFIAALGQPLALNLTSKIASTWFGDKERALASAVGLCGTSIGSFISFLIPQIFIKESDYNNLPLAKQHFLMYLLV